MIIIDEQTRQRVVVDKRSGDVVYTAKSSTDNTAITKENVFRLGTYQDYSGSRILPTRNLILNPRIPNTLQGQDPSIEFNQKVPDFNEVGKNRNIYRRRTKRIYRKL